MSRANPPIKVYDAIINYINNRRWRLEDLKDLIDQDPAAALRAVIAKGNVRALEYIYETHFRDENGVSAFVENCSFQGVILPAMTAMVTDPLMARYLEGGISSILKFLFTRPKESAILEEQAKKLLAAMMSQDHPGFVRLSQVIAKTLHEKQRYEETSFQAELEKRMNLSGVIDRDQLLQDHMLVLANISGSFGELTGASLNCMNRCTNLEDCAGRSGGAFANNPLNHKEDDFSYNLRRRAQINQIVKILQKVPALDYLNLQEAAGFLKKGANKSNSQNFAKSSSA